VIDLYSILENGNYGATLIEAHIPRADSLGTEQTTIEDALYDGEDFELLFTASSQYTGHLENIPGAVPITKIGYVTKEAEFLITTTSGESNNLDIRGYSH
jgi:thiamine monophosphate kinase